MYTAIEIGGQVRHIVLDFNAIARAEDATGQNLLAAGAFARMNAAIMTAVLWGGLLHESPELTLAEVRSWITYANAPLVTAKLAEAFNACFPSADEEEGADGADPKPRSRGKGSKPTRASSSA